MNGVWVAGRMRSQLLYSFPCLQVENEWQILVRSKVPALPAEQMIFDAEIRQSLPGEPVGLPGFSIAAPGENGVVPDK